MSVGQQRATHAERTAQLTEAARKIITGSGMEHLTIDNLAKETGLSEGAIYRHVSSKQEVLLLVLDDVERTWFDAVERGSRPASSSLDKLRNILQAHLSRMERRRGISFMVLNETLRLDDGELRRRAAQLVDRYLEALVAILKAGQVAGEVRSDLDPKAAAGFFLGMIQVHVTLWALHSHSLSLAEQSEGLWDLFRRAVQSPATDPR